MANFNSGLLLAGPRGRRLCLELARILDDKVREASFYASYALDPGAGTSVRFVEVEFDPDDPTHGTQRVIQPREVPAPTPAEFAGILNQVQWREPRETEIWQALDNTVANARYWQPPDGGDNLAANPEVKQALRPIAAMIAANPATKWWSTPLDPNRQELVSRPQHGEIESPEYPPLPTQGENALSSWREAAIAEENRMERDYPGMDISGTWWSTPPNWVIPKTTRNIPGFGPIGLSFQEDSFGDTISISQEIPIPLDARVFEITGPDNWVELCRKYPLNVTASRNGDWRRTTGRAKGNWVQPDWSVVAKDYDGVHITMLGYLTAAGRSLPVKDDIATVIAGWDPDATYWLSGLSADQLDSTPQQWNLDPETAQWHILSMGA